MEANLQLKIEEVAEGQDYQIIVFNGEFDKAGFAEVGDQLRKAVQDAEVMTLIFDFKDLKFINSEGIGYLMEVHSHLAQRGRKFVILGLNDHIEDVFRAVGIYDIIAIYKDLGTYLNQ